MNALAELLQRAERLQKHVELLRQELEQLRRDLQRLQSGSEANGNLASPASDSDCLAVALAMAADLGPEFSSEDPHGLADRGTDWFQES